MREGEYILCKVGRRSPKNKNCEGRRCHHWAQWYQIFIENLFHSLFFSSFSSSSSLRHSTLISLLNAFSFRNSKILRAFFLILYLISILSPVFCVVKKCKGLSLGDRPVLCCNMRVLIGT